MKGGPVIRPLTSAGDEVRDVIRRGVGEQIEHDCAHRRLNDRLLVLKLTRGQRVDEVRVRRRLWTGGGWTWRSRRRSGRRRLQIAEQPEWRWRRNHSATKS